MAAAVRTVVLGLHRHLLRRVHFGHSLTFDFPDNGAGSTYATIECNSDAEIT